LLHIVLPVKMFECFDRTVIRPAQLNSRSQAAAAAVNKVFSSMRD